MIKILEFILAAFGFSNWYEFKESTFGFIMSLKIISLSALFATVSTVINDVFGFSHLFLVAYILLLIFEYLTGVIASIKRKEKHESRKLGRMLLKIAVYLVPIYILNTFQKEVEFPSIADYEIDPFKWLYWTVVLVIVWQLIVSLLENMEQLNFKYAGILLKIINRRFYKKFELEEEEKKSKGKTKA